MLPEAEACHWRRRSHEGKLRDATMNTVGVVWNAIEVSTGPVFCIKCQIVLSQRSFQL